MKKFFSIFIRKIKPRFLEPHPRETASPSLFNYKSFWIGSINLLTIVTVVPLFILSMINLNLTREAINKENSLRTIRLTSNARRTVTFFLKERLDAMRFVLQNERLETLKDPEDLASILESLQIGFGSTLDLGVLDESGLQINYVGPFDLTGKSYTDRKWFKECVKNGSSVSDVFLGYRQIPHTIISVKSEVNNSFVILRATLDIKKFVQILSSIDLSEKSDAFIVNREGYLQTPSKYYGNIFEKVTIPLPEYSESSRVFTFEDQSGRKVMAGYAFIEDSPYILMLVKQSTDIMQSWFAVRKEIIFFFILSAVVLFLIILRITTFMVNKVYEADQTRLDAMERLAQSSRLISIGRLAAGVAHEINNPLAIINENAGLIKDLFVYKKQYEPGHRLMGLIDTVLESVDRCGQITRQLLAFARDFKPKIQSLHINKIVSEVLIFLKKEAVYRDIKIDVDIPEDLPVIHSDHGSLQQIFLNLINNAFQAMEDGGHLEIKAARKNGNQILVSVKDDGCGISEEEQKKIFEPFYTSKGTKGGTGLGLSITFGLVKKLDGEIYLESKPGQGAKFSIILPLRPKGDNQDENLTG
jgi:signal transduction histidine kinase